MVDKTVSKEQANFSGCIARTRRKLRIMNPDIAARSTSPVLLPVIDNSTAAKESAPTMAETELPSAAALSVISMPSGQKQPQ